MTVRSDRSSWLWAALATGLVIVDASCGGGAGDDAVGAGDGEGSDRPALSVEAARGRQLAIDRGCAACHGGDFEGAAGPGWVGRYGREVELDGGATVKVDDAYLTRAIADPSADKVDGYSLAMPDNDLTADEIDSIVAYIRALGEAEG